MDIITLIKELVTGLLNAEEEFLKHLDAFPKFEETVYELTDQMAADFMGAVLTNADTLIRESGKRKGSYTEMVKHFCNTNTEKISLYYEYLFSNGVRYPFDECGRM